MDKIYFSVNGEKYALSGSDVSPSTTLNDYLRNSLQLHGTKAMCHEGGCGACVVSVAQTHPTTKEKHVIAVNSCLVHILSCHDWDITTVEGVGNRKDGYHPLQSRLAAFNGTQCGYCTPGWIMNMYSLYVSTNEKLTMVQVENSFGGNMCRCTGYRPILDAFKSFAVDVQCSLKDKVQDMEDLHKFKCKNKCSKKNDIKDDWCFIESTQETLKEIGLASGRWYKAFTLQDVFKIVKREGYDDYRLVAGNTGKGVYPLTKEPRVFIDISSIEALKDSLTDENLVLGGGMSLTEVMREFSRRSAKNGDFLYLRELYKHLDLVAHVPVRNIGTIGGNLALKNAHHEFPSDVFLLLDTVGATVAIMDSNLKQTDIKMQEFLKLDMRSKLILNVKLPPLSAHYKIRTYKIMPRAQNAHAVVNAGFLFKLDSSNKVDYANITFGAISPDFRRAKETANGLLGQPLFNDVTLQAALKRLAEELVPVEMPPEPSPYCRKMIALGLFYKAIISLAPSVNTRYVSGGTTLERGVSQGTQTFDTDKALWPLNQPVPKLEALAQCSGEAHYVCDTVSSPREVHVAFVLSDIFRGEILGFDASDALKVPGVVAFLTSKDIPGKNTITPLDVPWMEEEEELLASKIISYYGQPVGLVAATSHKLAVEGAKLVRVKCKKMDGAPVLTVAQALVAPDKDRRVREDVTIKPSDRGSNTTHTIKGHYSVNSQYHYTMETQSCAASVHELGITVRASTQWMDLVHVAVAQLLNVQENSVEVVVPRVGGGYGAKASRSAMVACSCALVAHHLNRPAKMVLPITDNMAAVGKRQQCEFDYELGVNDAGQVQYCNLAYYSDSGCSFNDSSGEEIASTITNLYDTSRWLVQGYSVLTDKASNTWCRAPATTEGTAIIEHLMERIAQAANKDPIEIRIMHLQPKHTIIADMITSFKTDSKFDDRKAEIKKFNRENAWKKRGLKLSIMSYPIGYSWNFPVTISVYHADGTVAMSHGGIEMGQGINTKVAQVCAYKLKIPLDKVTVRGSDSLVSPNSMATNGSITSESVAYATIKACEILLQRLEPAKKELNEPTWEEVVKKSYENGINLQASYMTSPLDSLDGYDVYGVCAAEVELDVLTGNHTVTRVDILEDTGVSISPDIDVGQIEGAFIMGLGLWTTEHLVYEESTGRLLTDRTWGYKPPGARDVPLDFRVRFRRSAPNPAGVLRSKATGEPALVLSVVVTHALHDAILDARTEFGYKDTDWINVDIPYSLENIIKAISPKYESFKLK